MEDEKGNKDDYKLKKEELEIKEIVPNLPSDSATTSSGNGSPSGVGALSLLDDPRNYGIFGDDISPYLDDNFGDFQQANDKVQLSSLNSFYSSTCSITLTTNSTEDFLGVPLLNVLFHQGSFVIGCVLLNTLPIAQLGSWNRIIVILRQESTNLQMKPKTK